MIKKLSQGGGAKMPEQHGSFVCLKTRKYSQTNTKPSCTPRKLIGGITQQSAQTETYSTKLCRWRSQDGETAWKLLCLASMKYSQTNTKPSYTPRKLIGGLTQQSAQPEPQNSAGTWHREVKLGREKLVAGREPPLQEQRTETGEVGRLQENHPSPKAAGQ